MPLEIDMEGITDDIGVAGYVELPTVEADGRIYQVDASDMTSIIRRDCRLDGYPKLLDEHEAKIQEDFAVYQAVWAVVGMMGGPTLNESDIIISMPLEFEMVATRCPHCGQPYIWYPLKRCQDNFLLPLMYGCGTIITYMKAAGGKMVPVSDERTARCELHKDVDSDRDDTI